MVRKAVNQPNNDVQEDLPDFNEVYKDEDMEGHDFPDFEESAEERGDLPAYNIVEGVGGDVIQKRLIPVGPRLFSSEDLMKVLNLTLVCNLNRDIRPLLDNRILKMKANGGYQLNFKVV